MQLFFLQVIIRLGIRILVQDHLLLTVGLVSLAKLFVEFVGVVLVVARGVGVRLVVKSHLVLLSERKCLGAHLIQAFFDGTDSSWTHQALLLHVFVLEISLRAARVCILIAASFFLNRVMVLRSVVTQVATLPLGCPSCTALNVGWGYRGSRFVKVKLDVVLFLGCEILGLLDFFPARIFLVVPVRSKAFGYLNSILNSQRFQFRILFSNLLKIEIIKLHQVFLLFNKLFALVLELRVLPRFPPNRLSFATPLGCLSAPFPRLTRPLLLSVLQVLHVIL